MTFFAQEVGYKRSDIEDLTTNEFYGMLSEIAFSREMKHWVELSNFAFVVKHIAGMLGKEVKIEDLIGKPPDRNVLMKCDQIDEWKREAYKMGLRVRG